MNRSHVAAALAGAAVAGLVIAARIRAAIAGTPLALLADEANTIETASYGCAAAAAALMLTRRSGVR